MWEQTGVRLPGTLVTRLARPTLTQRRSDGINSLFRVHWMELQQRCAAATKPLTPANTPPPPKAQTAASLRTTQREIIFNVMYQLSGGGGMGGVIYDDHKAP